MSDVPEGYRMSEVGVIPEDWGVKELDKEIDLLTGFPFQSNQYSSSGIRLLRGSNIKRGVTDWSDDITKFWQKITPDLKSYSLNEGDIVIAMDGSLVGRSFARLSKRDLPALLLQRVARIRSNKIDVGYLKEFICSDYFTKYCDSVKTVTAIPHISPGDIKEFQIPLPPLPEQQAIASALSDVDALITALEQLITKKRNIKQGAMQQLLTGEKRLPGFGGAWEVVLLGDYINEMTDYVAAGSFESLSKNVEVSDEENFAIYVRLFDIRLGLCHISQKYVDKSSYNFLSKSNLFGNELLVANIGANVGETFLMPIIKRPATIAPNMIVIRCNDDKLIPKYLFYYTKSNFGQSRILELVAGSGHPKINKTDLKKYKILLPPLLEQTAIAQILSDMDAEIEALEQKRDKYKAIKQGMMQELLTGKTRLV